MELATGGTRRSLDEIGEMSAMLQVKPPRARSAGRSPAWAAPRHHGQRADYVRDQPDPSGWCRSRGSARISTTGSRWCRSTFQPLRERKGRSPLSMLFMDRFTRQFRKESSRRSGAGRGAHFLDYLVARQHPGELKNLFGAHGASPENGPVSRDITWKLSPRTRSVRTPRSASGRRSPDRRDSAAGIPLRRPDRGARASS